MMSGAGSGGSGRRSRRLESERGCGFQRGIFFRIGAGALYDRSVSLPQRTAKASGMEAGMGPCLMTALFVIFSE